MIRKLMIIIMGIFLVICAGACNIYPLYLKTMMTKFDFTLKEVNLYGTFINLGLWVAFPMGWIYDKYGPKISCIIGCFFLSGSYILLHLLLNSDIISISIIPFLLIGLIMGQGSALLYTTSVTTNLKNFRFKASSAIVGLLTAHLALSPSVFTTYREAMMDIQISKYFTIIAIFIIAVISVCVLVFRNIKRIYNEDEEKKTYEKYKEGKIVKLLIFLSIVILVVYTFGIVFNSAMKSGNGDLDSDDNTNTNADKFPLVIVYPCLQLFNFVIVILEIYGVFDKLYFKPYIEKMIIKELTQSKIVEMRKEKSDNGYRNRNHENKEDYGNLHFENNENHLHILNRENDMRKNEDKIEMTNENVNELKISDVKQKEKFVDNTDNKEGFQELDINVRNDVGENDAEKEINNHDKKHTYKSKIDNLSSRPDTVGKNNNKQEKDNKTSSINFSEKNEISDINCGSNSLSNNINIDSQSGQRKASISNIYIGRISEKKEKMLLIHPENNQGIHPTEEAERSIPFKQAVLSKNVIILFFILILGVGSAISNLNNIEFIITSITVHSHVYSHLAISNNLTSNSLTNTTDLTINTITTDIIPTASVNINTHKDSATNMVIYSYVILYFVFNAFTKIISGLVLDYLLKIEKFFHYLIFIALIGLASQFTGIFLNKHGMLISISLAGITHGGYATFAPVFVRNEFGLTHMGKILGVLTTGCAIGSLFIADFVFILSYNINEVDGECIGPKCFRSSYIATSFFLLINLVLSGILLKDYLVKIKKNQDSRDRSKIHAA